MEAKVRRSHMVSRRYISAWGDKRGRIDVIDLEERRGYVTTYERATVVSYVYDSSFLEQENLEAQFGKIESKGIPALVKLREGTPIDQVDQRNVITFLDMHIERGRYANQAKVTTPALAVKVDGTTEDIDLRLADRMILSRYLEGAEKLEDHRLENWPWAVYSGVNLATGDGAVMRWAESKETKEMCTVTFPLSPTQLLVIGSELDERLPINQLLASKCRRWIVGGVGTLTKDPAILRAVPDSSQD